jgi:hypothetical protein
MTKRDVGAGLAEQLSEDFAAIFGATELQFLNTNDGDERTVRRESDSLGASAVVNRTQRLTAAVKDVH